MFGGTRLPPEGGAAALPAGLSRLRVRRARLELLAEGLCRHGRGADPSRAGSGAAGFRGGPAPRFRGARGAVAERSRVGVDGRAGNMGDPARRPRSRARRGARIRALVRASVRALVRAPVLALGRRRPAVAWRARGRGYLRSGWSVRRRRCAPVHIHLCIRIRRDTFPRFGVRSAAHVHIHAHVYAHIRRLAASRPGLRAGRGLRPGV